MKCMSQYIRIMSLKMRWVRIWATFGIQTFIFNNSYCIHKIKWLCSQLHVKRALASWNKTQAGIHGSPIDKCMTHISKHWMLNMNNTLLTSFYRLLDCQIELKPSNKGHYWTFIGSAFAWHLNEVTYSDNSQAGR